MPASVAALHERAERLLVQTQRAEKLSDGRFRLPSGAVATITDRLGPALPGIEPSLVIAYRFE